MKKKLATLLALAGVLAAGNVLAADTATVNVSATVLGTCSFNGAPYTIGFGQINPADTGDKTASTNISITCSNGTTWTLTDLNAAAPPAMTGDFTSTTLAYTFDAHSTTALGTGLPQTVAITARIANGVYQAAAADVYRGSVNIAVNP